MEISCFICQEASHAGKSDTDSARRISRKNENGEIGYPVQLFSVDIHDLFMHMVRWHWHPEIEIVMVRSGVADFLLMTYASVFIWDRVF